MTEPRHAMGEPTLVAKRDSLLEHARSERARRQREDLKRQVEQHRFRGNVALMVESVAHGTGLWLVCFGLVPWWVCQAVATTCCGLVVLAPERVKR